MKKISLSIPIPCHENWNEMTPSDKGRFCAACQKTVVDFTTMSERQIAEFFKKTAGDVCGRFYKDQLNHGMEIPKKRVPWVKYIFQFSLPAFLVSLKTEAQSGKVAVTQSITDTVKKPVPRPETKKPVAKRTTSIGGFGDFVLRRDSISLADIKFAGAIKQPTTCNSLQGVAGGVRIILGGAVSTRRYRHTSGSSVTRIKDTLGEIIDTAFKKFSVYPNPVQSNSVMKIDLRKIEAGDYTISIINLAGEVIHTEEVRIQKKKEVVDLHLEETAAGTYFIHVFNRKTAASYSEKIVVQ